MTTLFMEKLWLSFLSYRYGKIPCHMQAKGYSLSVLPIKVERSRVQELEAAYHRSKPQSGAQRIECMLLRSSPTPLKQSSIPARQWSHSIMIDLPINERNGGHPHRHTQNYFPNDFGFCQVDSKLCH